MPRRRSHSSAGAVANPSPSLSQKVKYDAYIASDEWAERREEALERAEYRCQLCNGNHRLEAHHRTYERLGQEKDADLTVLCRACHDILHKYAKWGVFRETSGMFDRIRQFAQPGVGYRVDQVAAGIGKQKSWTGRAIAEMKRDGFAKKTEKGWVFT